MPEAEASASRDSSIIPASADPASWQSHLPPSSRSSDQLLPISNNTTTSHFIHHVAHQRACHYLPSRHTLNAPPASVTSHQPATAQALPARIFSSPSPAAPHLHRASLQVPFTVYPRLLPFTFSARRAYSQLNPTSLFSSSHQNHQHTYSSSS